MQQAASLLNEEFLIPTVQKGNCTSPEQREGSGQIVLQLQSTTDAEGKLEAAVLGCLQSIAGDFA